MLPPLCKVAHILAGVSRTITQYFQEDGPRHTRDTKMTFYRLTHQEIRSMHPHPRQCTKQNSRIWEVSDNAVEVCLFALSPSGARLHPGGPDSTYPQTH